MESASSSSIWHGIVTEPSQCKKCLLRYIPIIRFFHAFVHRALKCSNAHSLTPTNKKNDHRNE